MSHSSFESKENSKTDQIKSSTNKSISLDSVVNERMQDEWNNIAENYNKITKLAYGQ